MTMKQLFIAAVALCLLACADGEPRTAREAVERTCDRLMEGDYDAVLDRMHMFRAPADQEQLMAWAEQQSSAMIKTMMRQQIQSIFENHHDPIRRYEILSEELSEDGTKAMLVVAFHKQDTALHHTFSMRRDEKGRWYSNQPVP